MAERLDREEIAAFTWKYDKSAPGECHVFFGTDTQSGHQKVWLENWKDGEKTEKCSFRADELSDLLAALHTAKLRSGR